ncbi:MAG: archease [Candidatus Neomarinimicrobiota bacterium]
MTESALYKIFPHTSDLGVEVTGYSLIELFRKAGMAILDLVTEPETVATHDTIEIVVQADDRELLFREWLSELLYHIFVKEYLFKTLRIAKLDSHSLKAVACGEKIDYRRHKIKRELKSITYHQLQVSEVDGKWTGRFVIDV